MAGIKRQRGNVEMFCEKKHPGFLTDVIKGKDRWLELKQVLPPLSFGVFGDCLLYCLQKGVVGRISCFGKPGSVWFVMRWLCLEIAKCAGLPEGEKGRETRVRSLARAGGACTWDLAL